MPNPSTNGTASNSRGDNSSDICFICAEHGPRFWALLPCQHRICATCAVRMRVLYETSTCPWCKTEHPAVHITSDARASYPLSPALLKAVDSRHGLAFESAECKRLVMDANLQVKCPHCSSQDGAALASGALLRTRHDLKRHLMSVHNQLLCDICLAHRRCFPHELDIFGARPDLQKHLRSMHVLCPVCKNSFYGEDELLAHCRDRHEACHLCQRAQLREQRHADRARNDTHDRLRILGTFHANFEALEEHFRRQHYICPHPTCVEAKFVAFETELELKAHLATMHADSTGGANSDQRLQRSQQRQLRRLDIAFGQTSVSSPAANSVPLARPGRTELPPIPQPAAAAQTAGRRDYSSFFFAPSLQSSGDINEQSWHLQRQRNEQLEEELAAARMDPAKVRTLCQQFQSNQCQASDLVHRLLTLCGNDVATLEERWMPRLVDLQMDPLKRRQLEQAFETLVNRVKAFPPLPQLANANKQADDGKPFRGRIVFNRSVAKKPLPLGADPSRNPAQLLPSLPAPKRPATLRYTTALTGTTDIAASTPSASSSTTGNSLRGQSLFQQNEFPALPARKSPQPASTTASTPAVPDEPEDEGFVIGGGSGQAADSANSANKKKPKWKSVMRIGLQ